MPLQATHPMRLRWSWPYAALTIALLSIEVLIARHAHGWLRFFWGDVLIIITLFAAIRTIIHNSTPRTLIGLLTFATLIECAQFMHIPQKIGLKAHSALSLSLGATFDWLDLLAYALGAAIIFMAHTLYAHPQRPSFFVQIHIK